MGNYKKYSDDFKQEVLAMVVSGERSISQIERDLEITRQERDILKSLPSVLTGES